MSLINEALKRSEAERRAKCAADSDPAGRRDATVGGGRDADEPRKPSGSAATFVVCAAMLCAAVYLGLKSTDGLRLMAHSEPVPAPAEDSRSLELLELAKAETHQQNTDQMEQASLIVASTLQSVDYFDPIDAFAVSAVAEAEGARKDEVEVAPPKEALAAQPMPSADDFKLSAIIRGPDGATAIINGKFVKVGGDVKGATLIKLGRHTAELEIRGRRLVIQM